MFVDFDYSNTFFVNFYESNECCAEVGFTNWKKLTKVMMENSSYYEGWLGIYIGGNLRYQQGLLDHNIKRKMHNNIQNRIRTNSQ